MKNKIIALLALIVTLFAIGGKLTAQDLTSTLGVYNQYLAFGSGGTLHDEAVAQGDLTAAFKNGTYASLWFSSSLDGNWGNNAGDEADFIVGWKGDIWEDVNLNAKVFYFWEPAKGFSDIVYPQVFLSKPIGSWTATLQAGVYLPIDGSEGGWLWGPSVSTAFKLSEKWKIPFSAGVLWDDGGFGAEPGFVGNIFTGLNWQMKDDLTISLISATLYKSLGNSNVHGLEPMIGTGLSYQF